MPPPRLMRLCAAFAALSGAAACSPTFDWREVQPAATESSSVASLFPCRPDRFTRSVALSGAQEQMHMLSCSAGGNTFALSHVTAADASQLGAALQALRDAAGRNVGVPPQVMGAATVVGMTPQPLAQRLQFEGRRADQSPIRLQALFFAAGLQVYQATVVGTALDADAADTFFGGLRVPR